MCIFARPSPSIGHSPAHVNGSYQDATLTTLEERYRALPWPLLVQPFHSHPNGVLNRAQWQLMSCRSVRLFAIKYKRTTSNRLDISTRARHIIRPNHQKWPNLPSSQPLFTPQPAVLASKQKSTPLPSAQSQRRSSPSQPVSGGRHFRFGKVQSNPLATCSLQRQPGTCKAPGRNPPCFSQEHNFESNLDQSRPSNTVPHVADLPPAHRTKASPRLYSFQTTRLAGIIDTVARISAKREEKSQNSLRHRNTVSHLFPFFVATPRDRQTNELSAFIRSRNGTARVKVRRGPMVKSQAINSGE